MKISLINKITENMIPDMKGVRIWTISGFKSSGKTTVAECLQKEISRFERGPMPRIISFADNITEFVTKAILNTDTIPYGMKESRLPFWSNIFRTRLSPRDFLIDFGEQMRLHYGKQFWTAVMLNKILSFVKLGKTKFIIPDLRFMREVYFLDMLKKKDADVKNILVLRKEALPDWVKMGLDPTYPIQFDIIKTDFETDPSELEWICANIHYQYLIKNDGTMYDLENQIRKVFKFHKK